MPSIKIDERTIRKVKKREGLYSSLNKQPKLPIEDKDFQNSLKSAVTSIIKEAFMDYAMKGHKAPKQLAELEWTRFNKFLQKKL